MPTIGSNRAASLGPIGCITGVVAGFGLAVVAAIASSGAATAASDPMRVLFLVSIAVVAVLVVPVALPFGRRLPVFLRWFIVSTLLTYLGILAVCTSGGVV